VPHYWTATCRTIGPPFTPGRRQIGGGRVDGPQRRFYLIEKQKRPQLMPQVLHWFKWESAIT